MLPGFPGGNGVGLWSLVALAFLVNAFLVYGIGHLVEWLVRRLRT